MVDGERGKMLNEWMILKVVGILFWMVMVSYLWNLICELTTTYHSEINFSLEKVSWQHTYDVFVKISVM